MGKVTLNENSLAAWQAQNLEHIRFEYDLKPDDLIIDIGAYKGEWANVMWKRYHCNIIAIEPTEYIKDFVHGQVINKAAGTHNGRMSFGGRAYYSSIFEDGDHEYECFDINTLLETRQAVALMKVNIEGCEYDLLSHIIGAGLHNRIKNLQIQFHQIAGIPYQQWYEAISKQLSLTHQLAWHYPFCWENWEIK